MNVKIDRESRKVILEILKTGFTDLPCKTRSLFTAQSLPQLNEIICCPVEKRGGN